MAYLRRHTRIRHPRATHHLDWNRQCHNPHWLVDYRESYRVFQRSTIKGKESQQTWRLGCYLHIRSRQIRVCSQRQPGGYQEMGNKRPHLYESRIPGTTQLFQGFTRFTSLLVLLFVFSTLPNGHTMDQLAFIILNAMAQVNALLEQWLNSVSCMSELHFEKTSSCKVVTRTDVYGRLIREFKDVNDGEWITALDLLPKTKKWGVWKTKFLDDVDQDPKDLYNRLPGR